MDDQRARVLDLFKQGKLTHEETLQLLDAFREYGQENMSSTSADKFVSSDHDEAGFADSLDRGNDEKVRSKLHKLVRQHIISPDEARKLGAVANGIAETEIQLLLMELVERHIVTAKEAMRIAAVLEGIKGMGVRRQALEMVKSGMFPNREVAGILAMVGTIADPETQLRFIRLIESGMISGGQGRIAKKLLAFFVGVQKIREAAQIIAALEAGQIDAETALHRLKRLAIDRSRDGLGEGM